MQTRLFMNANQIISELTGSLKQRITKADYNYSVHKITLMITLETYQRLLSGNY